MGKHPHSLQHLSNALNKLKRVGSCEREQLGSRFKHRRSGGNDMSLGTILIIILILVLLGVIPTWGHSRGWGYGPSGIIGLILIVVIILALMGRL